MKAWEKGALITANIVGHDCDAWGRYDFAGIEERQRTQVLVTLSRMMPHLTSKGTDDFDVPFS